VGFHLANLFAHILFQIIEGMEVQGLCWGCPGFLPQIRLELLFTALEQAAIGVVDDDKLFRAQKVMGNNQRTDGVVRGYSAGIADHVGITQMDAHAHLEKNARVHASKNG